MTSYIDKNLMNGESVIHNAKAHIFNYFPAAMVFFIGMMISGIFEPRIPVEIYDSEVVMNLDSQVDDLNDNVNLASEKIWKIYGSAKKIVPEEVDSVVRYVSETRYSHFGFVFMFLGMIYLLRIYIKHTTNEFFVTSRRVLYKHGFLTTDTKEIILDRIEAVKVKQRIIDRLIGRGDVIITGVGMEIIEMQNLSKPMQLRVAILESLENYKKIK